MTRLALMFLVAVCALALGCAEAGYDGADRDAPPPSRPTASEALAEAPRIAQTMIRGVTLDARQPPPPTLLPALADLGVTHVTVIPFAFQRRPDDPELGTNYDADWYTEGRRGIRALARQADTLGLHLVLKPQIWIRGGWSADIDFESETDWAAWEAAYREFALFYARLSAEIGAPLFVIGTELGRAGYAREAFWRSLIDEVRTVYDGELTYAGNWYEGYEHVPYWDALDYVGVQAYFPLTETEAPDEATLRDGWQRHKATLRAVHERSGKPVLFTEIGYRDVAHAAARPWEWPAGRHSPTPATPHGDRTANEALQARLYTAFFDEVWPQPWFAGAILWKWHPPGDRDRTGDFTPQGKPAEAVIRDAFHAAQP